jgi:hypothetical protein
MRTVLTVLTMVVVLAACRSAADPVTTPGPATAGNDGQTTGASGGEPASPSASSGETVSSSIGSCVEEYSLQTLRNRKFAFDGTVTEIRAGEPDPDAWGAPIRVTYQVHQWFAGGDDDTVTLAAWDFDVIVDRSSQSEVYADSVGTLVRTEGMRLLVSGDDKMAWLGCGFTRPYNAAEAAQWKAAFAE